MNAPDRFWKVAVGFVGLLIAFFAVLTIKEIKSISYVGSNTNTTNTINVDGTGEAVAVPDIATFSFSVTEQGNTVAKAQKQATDKIDSALKAVRDGGVADKDIQTQSYSINPHYEYQNAVCSTGANYCPPGKQVLDGYEVSQTVMVKVRDLSKAGALFSSIGSIGVQNVNGLNFSVDKPESVQADAREKAIKIAQDKADKLARALGVRLVRIVSFNENNNSYFPKMAYAMASDGASVRNEMAPAPQIPAGETKYTANVSITYEIE